MHRFPRGDVRDLGSNMISSLDVAVDLEITAIAKKISGTRRRRRAFRAMKNRALLFAEVAGLLEGNHGLIDENFCCRFFIGYFDGLLGEGLGLAPPRVEGALAEHGTRLGVGLPSGCRRPSFAACVGPLRDRFWLLSIAAGGAGLPRGRAAAAGADFQWVRVRVFRLRAIFVARCPGVCRGRSTRIYHYGDSRPTPANQRRGLRLPRGGRLLNNLLYVYNQHSLHSVVARVQPELHDLPDHLGREMRRLR